MYATLEAADTGQERLQGKYSHAIEPIAHCICQIITVHFMTVKCTTYTYTLLFNFVCFTNRHIIIQSFRCDDL